MSDMIELNREFYNAAGFPIPPEPTIMGATRRNQMFAYFIGECVEIGNATTLPEQVAELTDLLYFVYDAFLEIGVDPKVPYTIVHASNMAKLEWSDGVPHFDESRVPPRILRPPGWQSPIESIKAYVQALMKYAKVLTKAGQDYMTQENN